MNKKASEARRKACVKKLVDNYELAPISEGTETQNDPENEDCCDICFMVKITIITTTTKSSTTQHNIHPRHTHVSRN